MPKKRAPSALKELAGYLKSRWKMFTGVLAGVAILFTSVGAISKNWDAVEPNFLTTRGFVRDLVRTAQAQNSVLPVIRDLQIESAEGKRSQANNAAANWKLERSKTQDPVTQRLIDQQISNQEAEVERLTEQLRTLNRLKAQGR